MLGNFGFVVDNYGDENDVLMMMTIVMNAGLCAPTGTSSSMLTRARIPENTNVFIEWK